MIFYSYFRASSPYRVRLGMALKGIVPTQTHYVNLREGMQLSPEHLALNPQGRIPALVLDNGTVLTQSVAILEYLDEAFPNTYPLLPADALGRARVRAIAHTIACDIQPMQNIRTTQFLGKDLGIDEAGKQRWLEHWLCEGLAALEAMLAPHPDTGIFCHNDRMGLADCCLVPQIFSAQRFGLDTSHYPTLLRIYEACMALPQLAPTHPHVQPDAAA